MATRIIKELLDDLDGELADETVTFALDGVEFEIDLNKANAKRLRDFMAEFQDHGRRLGRAGRAPQLTKATRQVSVDGLSAAAAIKEENRKIREWAPKNGWVVSSRGRIPEEVIEAFHNNVKGPGPAEAVNNDEAAAKVADEAKASTAKGKTTAKSVPAADFKAGDKEKVSA